MHWKTGGECLYSVLNDDVFYIQVHVNLLLIEARMQAELLYALRAITRYMTWCLSSVKDGGTISR